MSDQRHPPANRRCQIYTRVSVGPDAHEMRRCTNDGTHWVSWGGCTCSEPDPLLCEDEFESWECDGPHNPEQEVAA